MSRFSWTSELVREVLGLSSESDRESTEFSGVSTDTRTLRSGELYVALRGDRLDGHAFVSLAAKAGARGSVVEQRPREAPANFDLFVVDDSLTALAQLASARRKALDPTVIAITGTSGKTTTRELLAQAIGEKVFASPANYNNLVGVPLSMLRAPEAAEFWLLELASNQPGEINRLARIVAPDHGVITSVSEGHLEGLGDLRGVLAEKISMLASVPPGGEVLVSDEPSDLIEGARKMHPAARTVGLGPNSDERAAEWRMGATSVEWKWRDVDFRLPGYGAHLIRDGLFAAVMAERLGVDLDGAASRLREAKLPPMRGELRQLGDLTLLVDCYNANPASFRAAIDALAVLAEGRRSAVLAGTMLELGERSADLHEQVARWMIDARIDLIAATGEFATVCAALEEGLGDRLMVEIEMEGAYEKLAARLHGNEAVLIKASRGMKFERAIPLFERDFGDPGQAPMSDTKS